MNTEYDLVIADGNVISFQPNGILRNHHIGIKKGRISAISSTPLCGKKSINAKDKIVSPGFIDFHSHVNGNAFSADKVASQGATTTIGGERSLDGEVIKRISEKGFLINHGFYISHSFTLRRAVGIKDPYRAATSKEIAEMVTLAEQFFLNGVFGIHFGLEFVPGTSKEEMVALARLAKKYKRIVLIHLRKDGAEAIKYFDEVTGIARTTGASLHILHLMYMAGFKNIMDTMLEKIQDARAQGFDITADTGIYSAFPTCVGSSILDKNWNEGYGADVSIKNLLISSGIYAGEFCDEQKFEYLRTEFPSTLVTAFVLDKDEVQKALSQPFVYVSTNAADGPHYENVGHPETAGTFPRLLSKYVREEKVLDLIEAIGKITYHPARRFALHGKGELRVGYDADIVIFDDVNIQDHADYVGFGDPNSPPTGIEYVIVNGTIIVKNGELLSGLLPGKMIRHRVV